MWQRAWSMRRYWLQPALPQVLPVLPLGLSLCRRQPQPARHWSTHRHESQ